MHRAHNVQRRQRTSPRPCRPICQNAPKPRVTIETVLGETKGHAHPNSTFISDTTTAGFTIPTKTDTRDKFNIRHITCNTKLYPNSLRYISGGGGTCGAYVSDPRNVTAEESVGFNSHQQYTVDSQAALERAHLHSVAARPPLHRRATLQMFKLTL